jgi:biopolymer transport protein ExbD
MARARELRGSIAARGLVPLLDTLFLLLFALLAISGPRVVAQAETLLLRLPRVARAGAAAPDARTLALVLDVDAEARVTLLGDATPIETRAELARRIAAALGGAAPEQAAVEIRADAAAPHGVVVELLQHLRLAGFADVCLAAVAATDEPERIGGAR